MKIETVFRGLFRLGLVAASACVFGTQSLDALQKDNVQGGIVSVSCCQSRQERDCEALARHDYVRFMEDQGTCRVRDFEGEAHQKPDMGCELSDYGSWCDVAYSGGINRFWMNSLRHHTYDQVGFNTTQDVGMIALFFQSQSGELVDGDGESVVRWYPYGWKTTTKHGALVVESSLFYTAFNTVVITCHVRNDGTEPALLTPALLVTGRSEYDGRNGGRIVGKETKGNRLLWRNQRVGQSSEPKDYTDCLVIGSTLGDLHFGFLPRYLRSDRGKELNEALLEKWLPVLDAKEGAAVAKSDAIALKPSEVREFAFYVAAGADDAASENLAEVTEVDLVSTGTAEIAGRVERDWNVYLGSLPKLLNPGYEDLKLYYSAAIALRRNRLILKRPCPDGVSKAGCGTGLQVDDSSLADSQCVRYDASCPGRGAFNLFFQSDSCWNTLGYLDINPDWAAGHAVPMLEPPCIIMDPHFFWSMWEIYSRLPDGKKQREFAAMAYPLLKEAYRVWTTDIDIDRNLLCATPNNWDDNPRADLLYKEATDIPGQWNSWWMDWVNFSRDRFLEDPASSAQLAYGTVVMGRLARILGKDQEAAGWDRLSKAHAEAIDTLWDGDLGYWITTYRHSLTDNVNTCAILHPVFADMCRDPAKIRRVIESHILNPEEYNGKYPIPTVAYNDPRYYKQKPPRQAETGGLWRGNIWMPEAWVVVKGLYKYGYEAEADAIARRLIDMMEHQEQWSCDHPQFAFSPAEYYDSRTGEAMNNRQFSWSSAVAMDFQLGNYQNERMLGTNSERDCSVNGHVREVFDFDSGKSLFRVKTDKTVFPVLHMASVDGLPINKSANVEFSFSDPADNFTGSVIRFFADPDHWSVVEKSSGSVLKPNAEGYYPASLNAELMLVPHT